MKKILSILSVFAMVMVMTSCSNDEGGKGGDVTRSMKVINHIVNTKTSEVMPLTTSQIDYKINRDNMTLSLTIRAKLDGAKESTVEFKDLTMTENKGVYSFKASGSGVEDLRGKLDFNEGTLRLNYNIDGKYRVIATTPEVFSTKCATSCVYGEGKSFTSNATMYQYNIDTESLTAKMVVMDFVDQSAKRTLTNVKALTAAKVTVTKDGYVIEAESLPTTTTYILNGKATTTTLYPIADLKATIDLENDKYDATFKLANITITATGAINN